MDHQRLFKKLIGSWEGMCRTWFEPGQLADESVVMGEFSEVLEGRFVRHTYKGSIQGKPRQGEEMIAFNKMTEIYQIAWVDDFHMNYAILFSQGVGTQNGFKVTGHYDVGKGHPQWGWRTEYELRDDNHLVVTAFNIAMPTGEESKAVEVNYRRQ